MKKQMGSCLMVDIYIQRGKMHPDNDSQDTEPLVYIKPLLRSKIRRYHPQSIVDIYKKESKRVHMHGSPNRRFQ